VEERALQDQLMSQHTGVPWRERGTLVESLRRVGRLTAALFESKHVSEQDRQSINSRSTMCEKAERLVDVLCNKSPAAYHSFIEGLHNTKQAHLAELITNKGKDN
jgi:hypothetical protein